MANGRVYWTSEPSDDAAADRGPLMGASLQGGSVPEKLMDDTPSSLVSDGIGLLYVKDRRVFALDLAKKVLTSVIELENELEIGPGVFVDHEWIGFTEESGWTISRWGISSISKTERKIRRLVLADVCQSASRAIAADSAYVYWLCPASQIRRVPRGGGSSQLVVTMGGPSKGLAVDDAHLYWTERVGGRWWLFSMPKPK